MEVGFIVLVNCILKGVEINRGFGVAIVVNIDDIVGGKR